MFSDPAENVKKFGLTEGARVADFGTGTGAYALALSQQVGHTGMVYAVEIQKDLLERLSKEIKQARAGNIKIVWGDVDKLGGSTLRDSSLDAVLIANVLFQSDAKYTLALEAKRVLQPGGRVIVIDWLGAGGQFSLPPERVVRAEEVKKIFAQAGFQFASEFPAGAQHYGLIFLKAKTT